MSFSFIDLFAGIGGIRIAFQNAGGKCVFSSEYDRFAQLTYKAFFYEKPDFSQFEGDPEVGKIDPPGDITQFPPHKVPDHDILTGGFPCQPFSLAGVSKKQSLGRPHGFDDPTQGTLFFNIKKIIETKAPKAFLLENVKNLISHDRGRTFEIIYQTLESLGYEVCPRIMDASGWVPQHRERIYIAGFRKPDCLLLEEDQSWTIARDEFQPLLDNLKPPVPVRYISEILQDKVDSKYTLGDGTWSTLQRHKENHLSKGQGFGYGIITDPEKQIARTLSARYHKDGAEILIDQGPGVNPRRLTPLECCRLMGFPKDIQRFFDPSDSNGSQPVSDTQAYRQFGNSVAVPVVSAIAKLMISVMLEKGAIRTSKNLVSVST